MESIETAATRIDEIRQCEYPAITIAMYVGYDVLLKRFGVLRHSGSFYCNEKQAVFIAKASSLRSVSQWGIRKRKVGHSG
jgi:hypothetical protein